MIFLLPTFSCGNLVRCHGQCVDHGGLWEARTFEASCKLAQCTATNWVEVQASFCIPNPERETPTKDTPASFEEHHSNYCMDTRSQTPYDPCDCKGGRPWSSELRNLLSKKKPATVNARTQKSPSHVRHASYSRWLGKLSFSYRQTDCIHWMSY